MNEEFEKRRRLSRRRMAQISFAALLTMTAVILMGTLIGGEAFADNMKAVTPLLTGMAWSFVAIIGLYLGASLTEFLKHKQP